MLRRIAWGWFALAAGLVLWAGVLFLKNHPFSGAAPVSEAPVWPEPALALHEVVASPDRHAGRRIVVRGRYQREHTVLVREERRGRSGGARVVTPLRLSGAADGLAVLVDRGWIPGEEIAGFVERDAAEEERNLYGRLRPLSTRALGTAPVSPRPFQRHRHALRPELLQGELPYALLPLLVVREAGSGVELPLAPVGSAPPARATGGPLGLGLLGLLSGALGALCWRRRA